MQISRTIFATSDFKYHKYFVIFQHCIIFLCNLRKTIIDKNNINYYYDEMQTIKMK